MVEFLGVLLALIASFVWGSTLVPLKLAGKVDGIQYSSFLAVGIFLSTIIAMPLLNFTISFNAYGLISGIMWGLANMLAIASIKLMGLSRVVPIIGAGIILTSFAWGILFFSEQLTSVTFAILGVAFLVIGIPLIVVNKEDENNNLIQRIVYPITAGIIFGSYVTPLKLSGLPVSEYIFSMVSGILITSLIIYSLSIHLKIRKINFNKITNSLSSGFLWTIGNIASLFAIDRIGLSIGLPLTQLQLLVAALWGVFYFKEVRNRQIILKIIFGAIMLIVGAAFLAFSK